MDYLHHHLLRLHGCQHVLPHGLGLHAVAELLCDLVAHVRVKQGAAHVLEGFGNIDFGDFAFTFKNLERALQSLAEVFEHLCKCLRMQKYNFLP